MRCAQLEHSNQLESSASKFPVSREELSTSRSQDLITERPLMSLPPLTEWVRVAAAQAEYRRSRLVDKDDVLQAARLLLPGVDSPTRALATFPEDWLLLRKEYSKNDCARRLKTELAFRMLLSGRTDLVPSAISLLPSATGLNTVNEQVCGLLHLYNSRIHC